MRKILVKTLCTFILLIETTANAQNINYFENETANPATTYSIESQIYQSQRDIIIHTPFSYQKYSKKRYPVLYMLDGTRNIKHVISTVQNLSSRRKIPELILVVVPAGKTRQQDYTPDYLPQRKSNTLGKASIFSKFLSQELVPFIDANFRTEPFRILSGHSRSGLFTINDFISSSSIFQAHFAFSPALWPNDYRIIERVSEHLSSNKGTQRFVYVNAGGEENEKMTTSLSHLRKILKDTNSRKLIWHTDIAPEETHGTTPIIGYYLGLRKLFIKWDKPLKMFGKNGYNAFVLAREQLEMNLGYKITFEERTLNGIGYALYEKQDYDNAQTVFRESIKNYPESAIGYAGFALSLEATDEIDNAYVAISKALELMGNENNQMTDQIQQHHRRISLKAGN